MVGLLKLALVKEAHIGLLDCCFGSVAMAFHAYMSLLACSCWVFIPSSADH